MMRAVLCAVFCAAAMASSLVGAGEPTILRRKDLKSLHVVEAVHVPLTLMIEGVAANTASSVNGISTEVNGDSLIVYVELGPASPRLSGSFDFTVIVPQAVSRVLFGPDGEPIWQR